MMLCMTIAWRPLWSRKFYLLQLSGLPEGGTDGGHEMLSCNVGIAEMTDTVAVPLRAEHGET
jgi:hypothetical protein